jgi:orotate phosphoribosyltransferase
MTTNHDKTYYGSEIAKAGLKIGAIKLRPEDPFTWASGYRMPIYNDNRMFLEYPNHRAIILRGFQTMQEVEDFKVIAGTSTAGIPHAAGLANLLGLPMIYMSGTSPKTTD